MSQAEYARRIVAAQDQWRRDRVAVPDDPGARELENGCDPRSITDPNQDLYVIETATLDDLVQRVEAMRPSSALEVSQQWQHISAAFREKSTAFGAAIRATIANGWRGAAANQATEAITNYVDQSQQLTLAAERISTALAEFGAGLLRTRALMPRTGDGVPVLKDKALPPEGVMKADDHSRSEAVEEARRVLRTVYWQAANLADAGVPVVPDSPKVVDSPHISPVIGDD
ncbi:MULTISPECIES: hypothetical protein [unclassified Nocardia]|uniref:PPE domain-containing protein n=1 Tax=unclassified Nocardia TaxID=2637762 RepID=UPI001CE437C5|nr:MULTISPECIES: hypothetical protein [unclassified Nocardia]